MPSRQGPVIHGHRTIDSRPRRPVRRPKAMATVRVQVLRPSTSGLIKARPSSSSSSLCVQETRQQRPKQQLDDGLCNSTNAGASSRWPLCVYVWRWLCCLEFGTRVDGFSGALISLGQLDSRSLASSDERPKTSEHQYPASATAKGGPRLEALVAHYARARQ